MSRRPPPRSGAWLLLGLLQAVVLPAQPCEAPGQAAAARELSARLLGLAADPARDPDPSVYLALRLAADHDLRGEERYLARLRDAFQHRYGRSPQAADHPHAVPHGHLPQDTDGDEHGTVAARPETGRLALYLLGLRAACPPPEPGAHRVLVTWLKFHLEEDWAGSRRHGHPLTSYYQYGLGVLALCVHRKRVREEVIRRLLTAERHGTFAHAGGSAVDTETVAALAFACLEREQLVGAALTAELRTATRRVRRRMVEAQGPDGLVGNVYSTPWAVQLFLATDTCRTQPAYSRAVAALLANADAFTTAATMAQALPALHGRSYLDVAATRCQEEPDTLTPVSPVPPAETPGNKTVRLVVECPEPRCPRHQLYDRLVPAPAGASLLDVLKAAAAQDPHDFTFETQDTAQGPFLSAVLGLAARQRSYWQLLRAPDTSLQTEVKSEQGEGVTEAAEMSSGCLAQGRRCRVPSDLSTPRSLASTEAMAAADPAARQVPSQGVKRRNKPLVKGMAAPGKATTASDAMKMLDPCRLKPDSVETEQIVAVLDETIVKLERSSLIPGIIDSLGRFADMLGPEITNALIEHRKLAAEMEHLLASSEEGDSTEEQRGCLCLLEQRLKRSVRNVLRLLLARPSLCQALKCKAWVREPPAEVFINAFGEFRNFMLERLLTSPVEEKEKIQFMNDVSLRIKTNTEAIAALQAELAAAIRTREEIHKDSVIRDLKNSMRELTKDCEAGIQQTKQEGEKQRKEERKASQARCARLQQDIQELGAQLNTLVLEHRASELALRKRNCRVETEIMNWVQKYNTDMGEKQAEYEEVHAAYAKEKAQLALLMEKRAVLLQEYTQIEEESRICQEKKEQALKEFTAMTLAATRIQAFWRGYLVRSHFKSKRNKKKKGKEKGKGKRKGKKIKK